MNSPIIILGAPRSGTNMLRDLLTAVPGLVTWPCDEINYIWRYGNARRSDDALPADAAGPATCRYIQGRFQQLGRHGRVVEKTCANTLRVPFVDRVLPAARYVHIQRDPFDAVPSIMLRWRGDAKLSYLLAKARFVPLRDLPWYGAGFLHSRLRRLGNSERRAGTWGPRFPGLDELAARAPLAELCARQWLACVSSARRDLATLAGTAPERVLDIRYEDFVADPAAETAALLAKLDVAGSPPTAALERISSSSVGKGLPGLVAADAAADADQVRQLVAPMRAALGYG